jgi:hypothetical protein
MAGVPHYSRRGELKGGAVHGEKHLKLVEKDTSGARKYVTVRPNHSQTSIYLWGREGGFKLSTEEATNLGEMLIDMAKECGYEKSDERISVSGNKE